MINRFGIFCRNYCSSQATNKFVGVMVRVWLPEGGSVGHVSLQTNQHYISLWPKSAARKPSIKWKTFTGEFLDNLNDDCEANGNVVEINDKLRIQPKEPHYTSHLSTIDPLKINKEFESMMVRDKSNQWTLLGDNKFFQKKGVHSCSSLSFYLLNKGGLQAVIEKHKALNAPSGAKFKFSDILRDNFIVTPKHIMLLADTVLEYEKMSSSSSLPANLKI